MRVHFFKVKHLVCNGTTTYVLFLTALEKSSFKLLKYKKNNCLAIVPPGSGV